MVIPAEVAWLIPTVLPLVIGLLVGMIVKRTFKLLIVIAVLIVLLVSIGAISLTFEDVYSRALEILPRLIQTGRSELDVLPYSSLGFLIGLGLGLWKG
ncbi:MAG: hypothetical protein M1503_07570 [Thaumarchaeota archaeon]|nr:hypothetical protein [Nitrososphaerota archaeon]MCL5318101.1 hypothetical protein [Nitrososphaerota archaeon]